MSQLILNRKQVIDLTAEVVAQGAEVTATLQEMRDFFGLDQPIAAEAAVEDVAEDVEDAE